MSSADGQACQGCAGDGPGLGADSYQPRDGAAACRPCFANAFAAAAANMCTCNPGFVFNATGGPCIEAAVISVQEDADACAAAQPTDCVAVLTADSAADNVAACTYHEEVCVETAALDGASVPADAAACAAVPLAYVCADEQLGALPARTEEECRSLGSGACAPTAKLNRTACEATAGEAWTSGAAWVSPEAECETGLVATDSRGPLGPTGPLGVHDRTPWSLCHRKRARTSARTCSSTVRPTAAH